MSEGKLVDDLTASGVHARHLPDVDTIVDVVAGEAREGDLVVVMSNGGFGGIHARLLDALGSARGAPQEDPRGHRVMR